MKHKQSILKFSAVQVAGFLCPYVGAVLATPPPAIVERWEIYFDVAFIPFFAIPVAFPFVLLGLIVIASRIPHAVALICGVVTFGATLFLHADINLLDAQSGMAVLFVPIWVTLLEIAVLVVGLAVTLAVRMVQGWRRAPLGQKN